MILIFSLIILVLSVVIHEVAHGAMADHLGDSTARMAGRLSLNPLKHLDPFGSIIVPLITSISGYTFGWAKPVPINPLNFSDKKYGELKVALAGPAINFLIVFIFGMILRFIPLTPELYDLFRYIVFINLLLCLFNLIPIPPLDGSHILFAFLPKLHASKKIIIFLSQYQFFILIFIIFVFVRFSFFIDLIRLVYKLIVGSPLFS